MRAYQTIELIFFIALYVAISYSGFKCLNFALKNFAIKKLALNIYSILSFFFMISFFLLFIWPSNIREVKSYSAHVVFNGLFSIDFVSKTILSFSFLMGVIRKKYKGLIFYAGIILAIGVSCSMLYGLLFEPARLEVKYIEISSSRLPKSFDNARIVHFSDIHLGTFLGAGEVMHKVKREINRINPELVLFTGDLVNNFDHETQGWESVFKEITLNRTSYSILGNHDYGNYSDWESEKSKNRNFKYLLEAHNDFGFKLLRNESSIYVKNGDSIAITGVENWGHPPFPQYANLELAMKNIAPETFNILLTHDPAHWDAEVKFRTDIDLSLAGHTHGMQWGIKKAGIPFSLIYLIQKNWAGLYKHGDSQLYVSAGIGMIGMPWRINMPPEITQITLKRIEVDGK